MTNSKEPKGCLAAILGLLGIKLGAPPAQDELPYRLRDDFLSPAELSFYRVLRLAVKDRAVILAKVNLADLLFVTGGEGRQAYRNKIDRKHVDFLLCHAESMRPLVAIELDDASHQRGDRAERDRFVNQAFQAAKLPMLRVAVRAGYAPQTLAAELAPYLGGPPTAPITPPPVASPSVASPSVAPPPVAPAPVPPAVSASTAPLCPKCGVPMLRRVASKGENKGREFWGCPNYPRCREVA